MCDPLPSQPSLSLPPAGLPQLQLHSRTAAAAQPVRASFFGVGAPEAILVGVVALVVFGPKGLAQAAKSLGSTLRSFAPTIRELTSVSQELKSTLEQVRFGVMPRWHAACLKSATMQLQAGAVNHARQQQSVLLNRLRMNIHAAAAHGMRWPDAAMPPMPHDVNIWNPDTLTHNISIALHDIRAGDRPERHQGRVQAASGACTSPPSHRGQQR
jgi:TatA/E family protein of Tat protein translocase